MLQRVEFEKTLVFTRSKRDQIKLVLHEVVYCIFHVVSAGEKLEVVQNRCSCIFRSEMLCGKCIIYFLSHTELAKSKS